MRSILEEPPRLISDAATDPLVRRALRSAYSEQPRARALRAAPAGVLALLSGKGLGIGSAIAGTSAMAKLAASASILGAPIAKWVALGALLGSSLAVVAVRTGSSNQTSSSKSRLRDAATSSRAIVTPRPREVQRPAIPEESEPYSPAVLSTAETYRNTTTGNELAQELTYLDSARQALSNSHPAAALKALDQAERLNRRALAPESTVLRVRALIASGRINDAQRVAERFNRAFPNSPQAAVLRDLMTNTEIP